MPAAVVRQVGTVWNMPWLVPALLGHPESARVVVVSAAVHLTAVAAAVQVILIRRENPKTFPGQLAALQDPAAPVNAQVNVRTSDHHRRAPLRKEVGPHSL